MFDFGDVRAEERDLDGQEQHGDGRELSFGCAPDQPGDGQEQHGVEDERSGHRHAVDVPQLGGGAEHERERDDANAERPVDDRHVDLAFHLGGVQDLQPGEKAELHRLFCDREGARDRRLGGDHGRDRGEDHQRPQRPAGGHLVEGVERVRVLGQGRVVKDEHGLAQVVEHQRGERETEPAQADRARRRSDPGRRTGPRRRSPRAPRRRAPGIRSRRGRS